MFVNGDGNWLNILNDAVVTYVNLPKQHPNLKSQII